MPDLKNHYIANCIHRIIAAECANRNINKRSEDIAEAVRLAAFENIEVAHKYLIQLCDQAEAGKYAAEQSVHPTCPKCGASLSSGTTPKDGKQHCPSCGASW